MVSSTTVDERAQCIDVTILKLTALHRFLPDLACGRCRRETQYYVQTVDYTTDFVMR